MKKILILGLWLIMYFVNFTYWQNVRDTITKNNEYFYLQDSTYLRLKEYKTNLGNKVYIVWGISYYDIKDENFYNTIFKNWILTKQDSFFVLTKEWQNQWISKSDNLFNSNLCLTINYDTYKLLTNHIEALVIPKWFVYWIIDWELPCYSYWNNLVFSSNSMYDEDLYYFVKNSTAISKEIKSIPITIKYNQNKLDLLYSVYKYILSSTDYNYEALNNLNSYKHIYYPWHASSVFQKYKVVCDWYIRAFMFILNFNWVKSERIVWRIQPIDNNELNSQDLLHSWLKVDTHYYDPTFDDSDWKISFDYFHKPLECFNLNHYTTWWTLFDTYDKRYNYIKNNWRFLIENCIEILRSSLYNDDKLVLFIKYSLENYSLDTNKKLMCSLFEECSNNFKSNQELVDKISNYLLTYSSALWIKKYNLKEELKNFKVNTPIIPNKDNNTTSAVLSKPQIQTYQLTNNDKLFIDTFFQKIEGKVSKYQSDKKLTYYKNLSSKLEVIINKKISAKNKALLNYLNTLVKNKYLSLK